MLKSIEFWLILAFIGAVLLVGRRAWQVAIETLDARKIHVQQSFEEAEILRREAQEMVNQARQRREMLSQEMAALSLRTQQDVAAIAASLVTQQEKWRADQARLLADRAAAMAQDRVRGQAHRVAQLALSAARILIQKGTTPALHEAWIEKGIQEIAAHFGVPADAKARPARRRKVQ